MHPPRLILASASPRRQSLLREAGFEIVIHPAHINEDDYPRPIRPAALAEYLAVAKSRAVAALYPEDITLGSDTVVALGNELLGKPVDADDARRMLRVLGGSTHEVISGVAVVNPAAGLQLSRTVTSTVQMRKLSEAEVEAYIAGNAWQGKAGGYGIQDPDPFVTRTAGSHTNIVGLPMEATIELLAVAGIHAAPR